MQSLQCFESNSCCHDPLTEMGTVSRSGYRVSAKIQQLLNTLKRPKRRHLEEFYEDDDVELEMAANPKDPNAPSPEGSTMMPASGPQLVKLESCLEFSFFKMGHSRPLFLYFNLQLVDKTLPML